MPPHHHIKKSGIKKGFKGESKNAAKRATGRMDSADKVTARVNQKNIQLDNRAARANHSKQLQSNRQQVVLQKKRLGSKTGSPKIVALVSLSSSVNIEQIARNLTAQCQLESLIDNPLAYSTTLTAQVEKKDARFTFIAVPRDPIAVADIAKVADVIYLVLSPDMGTFSEEEWQQLHAQGNNTTLDKSSIPFVDRVLAIDTLGNHFIQLLKAQGLPTTMGLIQGVSDIPTLKKQQFMLRLSQQYFHSIFDKDVSSFQVDNSQEHISALLRATFNTSPREIPWREDRTRMLTEAVQFVKNAEYPLAQQAQSTSDKCLYDMNKGTLKVTGFLRGNHSISANQLIHLTGFGDYQVINIKAFENKPIHSKETKLPPTLTLQSDEERVSLEGLLASSEQAALNGDSISFETSDNMNMYELNKTFQQNNIMGQTNNDSLTPTTIINADGTTTAVSAPQHSTFLDWRGQYTPYIKSLSTLSSGTDVVQQDAPVFTGDVIKEGRKTDDNNVFQSVWDSIDVDAGPTKTDDFTLSRFTRKLGTSDVMDGSLLQSDSDSDDDDDSDDDLDDEAMSYRAIQKEKKEAKRQQQINDGFSSTSSLLSTLSGFSMGSLRDPNLTPEQLKEKFQDLPYKEKVRRLLKYGDRGEDKLYKVRKRMEREEVSNPDEVEYHPSVTARARFVRYHPMKSYRHSVWDVNENLPSEYNQIVQFNNFDVSHRNAKDAAALVDENEAFSEDVLFEDDEMYDEEDLKQKQTDILEALTLPDGSRLINRINPERIHPITVYIANVNEEVYNMINTYKAYGLLWWLFNHERKVSISHMLIRRHPEYEAAVRSKDPMHVQIGFRRYLSAPIYSEVDPHVNDRALMKRFLPNDDSFYLATMYSRITYPPATVLLFAGHVLGAYKNEFPFNPLVASGRLVNCNPNKLILKRSVLTGTPHTVARHKVVVRHMFFNANDVKWFQPVELWTKRGHTGHITESRGLRGLYKSTFDDTFKEKHQVHMSLYKRQFPVWNPAYLG
jgi:pre-rRNA-processing protein TSR1